MGSSCTTFDSVDDFKNRMTSIKIDNQLKVDNFDKARTVKILLLGAGDSGKSTVFKQVFFDD